MSFDFQRLQLQDSNTTAEKDEQETYGVTDTNATIVTSKNEDLKLLLGKSMKKSKSDLFQQRSSLSRILRQNGSKNNISFATSKQNTANNNNNNNNNNTPSSTSSTSNTSTTPSTPGAAATTSTAGKSFATDNSMLKSRSNISKLIHGGAEARNQAKRLSSNNFSENTVVKNNYDELNASLKGISEELRISLYGTKDNICATEIDVSFFSASNRDSLHKNSDADSVSLLEKETQYALRTVNGYRLIIASENACSVGMNNFDLIFDKTASLNSSSSLSCAIENGGLTYSSLSPQTSASEAKSLQNGIMEDHSNNDLNSAKSSVQESDNENSNVSTLISQKELKEYIFGSPIRYLAPKSRSDVKKISSKLICGEDSTNDNCIINFQNNKSNNQNEGKDSRDEDIDDELKEKFKQSNQLDHNIKFRIIKIPMYEPLVLISTMSSLPSSPNKSCLSISMLMSSRYLPLLFEGWSNGLSFWLKNVQQKLANKFIEKAGNNTFTEMKLESERVFTSFTKNFIPNLLSYYEVPRLFLPPVDFDKYSAYNWFKQVQNWLKLKDDGHNRLLYILIKIMVDYKDLEYKENEIQRVVIVSANFTIANKLISILSAIIPKKLNNIEILRTTDVLSETKDNDNEEKMKQYEEPVLNERVVEEYTDKTSKNRKDMENMSRTLVDEKIEHTIQEFGKPSFLNSPFPPSRSSSVTSLQNGFNKKGLTIPNNQKNKRMTFGVSRENSDIFQSSSYNDGTSFNYLSSSLSSSYGTNGSWFGSFGSRTNSPIASSTSATTDSSKQYQNGYEQYNSPSIGSSLGKSPVQKSGSNNSLLHLWLNNVPGNPALNNNQNPDRGVGHFSAITTPDLTEHKEYPWYSPDSAKQTRDISQSPQSSFSEFTGSKDIYTSKLNINRSASRFADKKQLEDSVSKAFDELILQEEQPDSNQEDDIDNTNITKHAEKNITQNGEYEIEFKNENHADYLYVKAGKLGTDSLNGYYQRQIPQRLTSYHSYFNPNFQLQAISYKKFNESLLVKSMKVDLKILLDKNQSHNDYYDSAMKMRNADKSLHSSNPSSNKTPIDNYEPITKREKPAHVKTKCLLITLPTHEVKEIILENSLTNKKSNVAPGSPKSHTFSALASSTSLLSSSLAAMNNAGSASGSLGNSTSGAIKQRSVKFLHSNGKYNHQSNQHLDQSLITTQKIFREAFVVMNAIDVLKSASPLTSVQNELHGKHLELTHLFKKLVYNT